MIYITSFKLEIFTYIVKFIFMDNVAEDSLPIDYPKVVPLRTLVDRNCF